MSIYIPRLYFYLDTLWFILIYINSTLMNKVVNCYYDIVKNHVDISLMLGRGPYFSSLISNLIIKMSLWLFFFIHENDLMAGGYLIMLKKPGLEGYQFLFSIRHWRHHSDAYYMCMRLRDRNFYVMNSVNPK